MPTDTVRDLYKAYSNCFNNWLHGCYQFYLKMKGSKLTILFLLLLCISCNSRKSKASHVPKNTAVAVTSIQNNNTISGNFSNQQIIKFEAANFDIKKWLFVSGDLAVANAGNVFDDNLLTAVTKFKQRFGLKSTALSILQ